MRMSRKWIVALAAALMVSAVPVTSYGDVVVYNSKYSSTSSSDKTDSSKTSSSKTSSKSAETYGPGYIDAEDDDVEGVDLTVKKVSLYETYHETYKIYEESIADLFFLYSNVENGGLTHEPVMVDIPANISYTMEKDGVPYAYTSKQYVSAKGTYVLRLTAVENPMLPLSQQTEYQAVFRFRIQEKPPVEETAAPEISYQPSGSIGSIWGLDTVPVDSKGSTSGAVEAETSAAVGGKVTDDQTKVDAADTKPEITESQPVETEDKKPEAAGETEGPDAAKKSTVPRTQVYSPATGMYTITLENGKKVASSVPEGYIGLNSIELRVSDEDAAYVKLYRDDEIVEFINGGSLTENGAYRIELDGEAAFFTITYYVGTMEYYPAPAGMRFSEVRLNDTVLNLESDRYVVMEAEGIYSFVMNGEDGNRLEAALIKDTTAPEVAVTMNQGEAVIQYGSDDIASVVLEKDGAVVEGFAGSSISTPGSYRLTVVDEAGNVTFREFSLSYQINLYGIAAIVLVILVAAGLVGFVIHTKKNMKVR